jgi:hypothetical protein
VISNIGHTGLHLPHLIHESLTCVKSNFKFSTYPTLYCFTKSSFVFWYLM